jgi:puromycin-sensitive aminopeptidase
LVLQECVRSQDTVFVIGGATGTVAGREAAWNFVKERWSDLHERYQGGFLLARLIKTVTQNFVTDDKDKDIRVRSIRCSPNSKCCLNWFDK